MVPRSSCILLFMNRDELKKAMAKHKASESHGSKLGPYIHDIVYGANDGIVTTFAIVSGVTGAQMAASIVVILGYANVLADGLSMGLGNYLSIRSKEDNYHRLYKEEELEIEQIPDIEREEIREIYAAKGFAGQELETVVKRITNDRKLWIETMMLEEHGLTKDENGSPIIHGLMTFLAFLVFGSIPIVPYMLPIPDERRFVMAIIATGIALLGVGLLRSWVTRERLIKGPLEILAVGAVCAAAAYGVGVFLRGFGA